MLIIPDKPALAAGLAKDLADECMATSDERQAVYQRAGQYYYTGSSTSDAAIHNKTKPWINRYAGFLYQSSGVRFNTVFDSSEPADVLERGRSASSILTADYRSTDSDLRFGEAVTWSLICGNYIIKHIGDGFSARVVPVHPTNFGVLTESILRIEEQECICHVSYPTVTRLRSI